MFEKNLQLSYLLDFYGDVLPPRKREVMDLYYNDDLSLAEIADQMGITRQAVRDAIKKTETELLFYEEKLGLLQRFTKARDHAARALALCEESDRVPEELRREVETLVRIVSTEV